MRKFMWVVVFLVSGGVLADMFIQCAGFGDLLQQQSSAVQQAAVAGSVCGYSIMKIGMVMMLYFIAKVFQHWDDTPGKEIRT